MDRGGTASSRLQLATSWLYYVLGELARQSSRIPHSAKLGIEKNQSDSGYAFIKLLEHVGLATGIKGPDSEPSRFGLVDIGGNGMHPASINYVNSPQDV